MYSSAAKRAWRHPQVLQVVQSLLGLNAWTVDKQVRVLRERRVGESVSADRLQVVEQQT